MFRLRKLNISAHFIVVAVYGTLFWGANKNKTEEAQYSVQSIKLVTVPTIVACSCSAIICHVNDMSLTFGLRIFFIIIFNVASYRLLKIIHSCVVGSTEIFKLLADREINIGSRHFYGI